ncbi:MAG: glycosyltransferase family 39 protein [Candidatus Aquirickettsiella sp.]
MSVAIALLGVLAVKCLLAGFIPITADEAYYAIWGAYLSGGGYDHPPMIGFVLYPLLQFGHHALTLRLPAILASLILGVVTYLYLKKDDPVRAALASVLLMIAPISLFNIIITTDTPLFIFSFLSVMCVLQALKKNDDWRCFAFGGLFLGLAFFSKYFACLLGVAYAVYFLFIAPNRARLIGLGLLALFTLPFVVQNIYWNYQHDWPNILFNIYNRNNDMGFSIKTILQYLLILFYLITPPLLLAVAKFPKQELKQQAVFYFFFIPLLLFFLLSSFKPIGVHWPLAFIPLIYVWAGLYLSTKRLRQLLKFTIFWTGIQLILIISLLFTPLKSIQHRNVLALSYNKIVYFFHHKAINDLLKEKYPQAIIYASPNYADACLFFYDTDQYASVFLTGSYHGREDDLITNFKNFNNKNFLIFSRTPLVYNDYKPYFQRVSLHTFHYEQALFYYLIGTKFNYSVYRQKILKVINDTYWIDPPYLPHAPSFFYLKYNLRT